MDVMTTCGKVLEQKWMHKTKKDHRGPRRAWILVGIYRTRYEVPTCHSLTKSARLGEHPFRYRTPVLVSLFSTYCQDEYCISRTKAP